MVVFAGDMNEHIGSRILEFADGLNLVNCNTIVYEAGSQVGNICSWPSEKYS